MVSKNKFCKCWFESVKSSNIRAIGYVKEMQLLVVEFNGSSTYLYQPVPKEIYDNLMKAKSPGAYLYKWVQCDEYICCTKLPASWEMDII